MIEPVTDEHQERAPLTGQSGDVSNYLSFSTDEQTTVQAPSFKVERNASTYGPMQNKKEKYKFYVVLMLMAFTASMNDFLVKLSYQSLPNSQYVGLIGLSYRFWICWLVSFGTFGVCSLSLLLTYNNKTEWFMFRNNFTDIESSFAIAGTAHVALNVGRYLGLIFLPAPCVSLLKNGSQSIFAAIFRVTFQKKTLTKWQWFGLFCTLIGLLLVIIAINLDASSEGTISSKLIGISLEFFTGFCGAIRNQFEQKLTKYQNIEFNTFFIVGLRSFHSLILTCAIGGVLYSLTSLTLNDDQQFNWVKDSTMFHYVFIIFIIDIFIKNVSSVKVIQFSSSITRNLVMAASPFGTWAWDLILFYTYSNIETDSNAYYGESWTKHSWLRFIGFIIVVLGNYFYIVPPKKIKKVMISVGSSFFQSRTRKAKMTPISPTPLI